MPQLSVEMMKFVNSLSIGMHWHHGFAAECYEAMKAEKVRAVDLLTRLIGNEIRLLLPAEVTENSTFRHYAG